MCSSPPPSPDRAPVGRCSTLTAHLCPATWLLLVCALVFTGCDDPEPAPDPDVPDALYPDGADVAGEADAPGDTVTPDTSPADVPEADATEDTPSDVAPPTCPTSTLAQLPTDRFGRFEVISDFPGGELADRDLVVYLPEGYDASSDRYPVLYMHDGQNLFDSEQAAFGVEWRVDETLDALVASGLEPWIVVGIDNAEAARIDEYTPVVDLSMEPGQQGGGGDAYAQLLVEDVKPYIDTWYRTRCGPDDTAIAGSSLGGLINFYIFQSYPGVFGRVGCLSSSLWWDNESVLEGFEESSPELPERLWLDGGTGEGGDLPEGDTTTVSHARRAALHAVTLGGSHGVEVGLLEDPGAPHNEWAWSQRLTSVLGFLLSRDGVASRPIDRCDLTVYRPWLEPGQRTRLALERVHGGVRLTFPTQSAVWELAPEGIVTLEPDGRVLAVSAGTAVLSAEERGSTARALVQVGLDLPVLRFEVVVPGNPTAVHLSGSAVELGEWDGVGVAMTQGDEFWFAEVSLPIGTDLEYKYTQGSWASVEMDGAGVDIGNRGWRVDNPALAQDVVAGWAP